MGRETGYRLANIAIALLVPVAAMLLTDMKVYDYSVFEEFAILSAIPFLLFVFYIPSTTVVLLLVMAMRIASVVLLVRGNFTSTRRIVIKTALNVVSSLLIALVGLFVMVVARQ